MASKRDNEMVNYIVLLTLFVGTLIGVDIYYSSFEIMSSIFKWSIYGLHSLLVIFIIVSIVNSTDPNFDKVRKWAYAVTFILIFSVGIHHATAREDNQVIINSKENTK